MTGRPSSQELADRVRRTFGDCDCRAVGETEHADYWRTYEAAQAALDALAARLQATEQALAWIAENAESWHGPEDSQPEAKHRALGVIASTARRALEGAVE